MQSQKISQTFKPVLVYFKKAWTENTKKYYVYPDWTLNQFRDALKPMIANDFQLEPDLFELVLVGQDLNENGLVIDQSIEIKLYQLWGRELAISFYVRHT